MPLPEPKMTDSENKTLEKIHSTILQQISAERIFAKQLLCLHTTTESTSQSCTLWNVSEFAIRRGRDDAAEVIWHFAFTPTLNKHWTKTRSYLKRSSINYYYTNNHSHWRRKVAKRKTINSLSFVFRSNLKTTFMNFPWNFILFLFGFSFTLSVKSTQNLA